MGVLYLAPVEPVLLAVIGSDSGPCILRLQQQSFVFSPTVVRVHGSHDRPLPRETQATLDRPQRSLDPGRTDLQDEATWNGLIYVETVGNSPAEGGTIPDPDATRTVEKNPHHPTPPLYQHLDIDELVTLLVGQGLHQLAKLFPHFQRATPRQTKNGVVAPTPLLRPAD
jgi:hypothetical protein